MKKFYAMMMALVVALSASAFDLSLRSGRTIHAPGKSLSKISMKKSGAVSRAEGDPLTLDGLVGTWDWMYYDMLEDDVLIFPVKMSIMDEDENLVLIDDFILPGCTVGAIFDPDAQTLEIPYSILQELDSSVEMYASFAVFDYELDEGGSLDVESLAPTKETSLVLEYDADFEGLYNYEDIYGVVAEVEGELYPEEDGWFCMMNQAVVAKATVEPEDVVDNDDDFEDAGFAEFKDGWIYPGIMNEYPGIVRVVPLQKSIVEEGVYRMVDPYGGVDEDNLAADYNVSMVPGYIKFNIADTRVPYVYTNVFSGYATVGEGNYYVYDFTGYYVDYEGEPANYYYLTTQHAASKLSTFDEETNTMTIPAGSSLYGVTGQKFANFTAVDPYTQEPSTVETTIKILPKESGIETVGASQAPYEFYNLQGVSVNNPGHGVYIMRQGTEYKKVIR